MAHLFLWTEIENAWSVLPLTTLSVLLTDDPVAPARLLKSQDAAPALPCLLPVSENGAEWALLASPIACRVNGEPVYLGLRALSYKDEIRLASGARCFFSTETSARVVPFPGADRPVFCPRCQLEIKAGDPAVICPGVGCGIAYHEDPASLRPCWTYGPCLMCGEPGVLDAGLRWSPEDL